MSLQQRFEESRTGQAFLSVLFIALIIGVFAWNLPGSQLANATSDRYRPVIRAVGLDQNWELFAPVPRKSSIDLRADIKLADGSQVSWRPPAKGRFLTPYHSYRWRKWMDHIHTDAYSDYWYQFALWIAHRYQESSPVSVTLVRLWKDSTPPGTSQIDTWHSYAFYTLQLGGSS